YERQAVMAASHSVMRWLHLPVMLLALCGAVIGILRGWRETKREDFRQESWAPHALAWIAVLGTLAYVPVIPDPRYLQPIRPLLFVLAGAALPMLLTCLRRRPAESPPLAVAN